MVGGGVGSLLSEGSLLSGCHNFQDLLAATFFGCYFQGVATFGNC